MEGRGGKGEKREEEREREERRREIPFKPIEITLLIYSPFVYMLQKSFSFNFCYYFSDPRGVFTELHQPA